MTAISFFFVAFLYSMVGLGGGSSYIAVLALVGCPYEMIPPVALACNIIVVTSGATHFIRNGHFRLQLSWPFILCSVPMAYIGAMVRITEQTFFILLGLSLLLVGGKLLFFDRLNMTDYETKTLPVGWAMAIGMMLGLLSGMVGIGGGIFLAPVLLFLRWGTPKQIAATAAVFVLVNSLSGLSGQLFKHQFNLSLIPYWPLFVAVWFGGQLGSAFGATKASQVWVKKGTAFLVSMVGLRVLFHTL